MRPQSDSETRPAPARRANWSAAILAGVLAGVAWFGWRILASWWVGQPPWATERLIASLALGQDNLRLPPSFDPPTFAIAAVIHLGLSILYACTVAPLLSRLRMGPSLATGVVFGALLYVVNLYGFAPALFPGMIEMRDWITLVSHLLFGLVLAYVYKLGDNAQAKSLDQPASQA
jgi:hypothetical protein